MKFIYVLIIFLFIGCEKLPYVGKGYKLQLDSNDYVILTDLKNTFMVSGHILNATSDSTFILLYQKPVDSICECNYECFKHMPSYDKKSHSRCKKAFKESVLRKYWIVDKSKKSVFDTKTRTRSNVYGPYDMNDYLKKRDELRVPPELILEVEEN